MLSCDSVAIGGRSSRTDGWLCSGCTGLCLLSDCSWVTTTTSNNISLLVSLSSWFPSWFIVSYFCNMHIEHLEQRVRCRGAPHTLEPHVLTPSGNCHHYLPLGIMGIYLPVLF